MLDASHMYTTNYLYHAMNTLYNFQTLLAAIVSTQFLITGITRPKCKPGPVSYCGYDSRPQDDGCACIARKLR